MSLLEAAVKAIQAVQLQSVGDGRLGINDLLAGTEMLLDHADDGRDVFEDTIVGVITGFLKRCQVKDLDPVPDEFASVGVLRGIDFAQARFAALDGPRQCERSVVLRHEQEKAGMRAHPADPGPEHVWKGGRPETKPPAVKMRSTSCSDPSPPPGPAPSFSPSPL
jgi:hypothetical protein